MTAIHPLAGKKAPEEMLENIPRLVSAYYTNHPDLGNPAQRVAFGTSGHRGSAKHGTFNEEHILAISQAICEYRAQRGYTGPLFMGMDTHALSEPALVTAVEVMAAQGVALHVQSGLSYTPTPVVSHAILTYNRSRATGLADGVVITPSHNPPEDGGFKYNPPEGGPADTAVTSLIEDRANAIMQAGVSNVKRWPFAKAFAAATQVDLIAPYVNDLKQVIDLKAIKASGLRLGVDPLGGATLPFWQPIAERYGLDLTVVNGSHDPTFSFMTVDRDGKIRMDCSSPHAMAGLIALKDRFDLAFGNDPDGDRHGIVTCTGGLLNPNHFLAAAIYYLYQHRPHWPRGCAVGKTLVSSSMIDRVATDLQRQVCEVPVGFKWFVDGLNTGRFGFAGEESAGASFLRRDGTVWTTDKDGIILDLIAAEMTAVLGRDPYEVYRDLTERFGEPIYERIDAPATKAEKARFKKLTPAMITATTFAGEAITAILTQAPGNGAAIGGLKVVTENGWFAARPSGTEDVYKIYAESFRGREHLVRIQTEAQSLIAGLFASA